MMPDDPTETASSLPFPAPKRVIHNNSDEVTLTDIAIGVVIGRSAEYFNFFVFGIACVLVFPSVFFPFVSPTLGTIYSFVIFSFAFIARPFGSVLFSFLHVRYGRAAKLSIALFALGTATAVIAFLPGYNTIGFVAIVLLGLFRIAQGIAIGGSWDGLPSLLALNAPEKRRGWYASIPQLSAPIGFIIAAALFAYLTMNLSQQDFLTWGWRYPFFVAFALNVVALFARVILCITPEFARELEERELRPVPIADLAKDEGRTVLLGAFAPLASYALFHLVTIFSLSWAILFTDQPIGNFLLVQILGAFLALASMLIAGKITDRVGRRVFLFFLAVLIAIYSGWVAVLLAGSTVGGYLFILIGFVLLGLSHSQSAGSLTSGFSKAHRYSGAAFSSDLSWLFGAAFAPLIALLIAVHFGVSYVGLYLLSGAVVTLAVLRVNHLFQTREEND